MRKPLRVAMLACVALLSIFVSPASAAGTWSDTGAGKANSATVLGTLDDGTTSWASVAPSVYTQPVGRVNEQIYFSNPASGVAAGIRVIDTNSESHIVGIDWSLPYNPNSPYEDYFLQIVRYTDAGTFVAVGVSRGHYMLVEYINGSSYVDLEYQDPETDIVPVLAWPTGAQTNRHITVAANGDTIYLYEGENLVDTMVVSSRADGVGFGSLLNFGGMAAAALDNIAIVGY